MKTIAEIIMENSLVYAARGMFQDSTVEALAMNANETSENIERGLAVAIPITLLALARKSQQHLENLLINAKSTFNGFTPEADLSPSVENYAGSPYNLLEEIMGENQRDVYETIGRHLNVSSETVHTLFAAALPAVFSVLTRSGQDWDSSQVKNVLEENEPQFASSLPDELAPLAVDTTRDPAFHASIPPATPADAIVDPTHTSPPPPVDSAAPFVHTPESVRKKRSGAGIWWLLILIIIVGLWFYFGKGCAGSEQIEGTNDTSIIR